MEYFERVTVALCLQPVDADVLRYARLIRDMGEGKTEFCFIHVVSPGDGWHNRDHVARPLPEVRSELQRTVAAHFGEVPEDSVRVLPGAPLDELLETAAQSRSDLVVLGHRRAARGRRSSSRRLGMKAPCSVWMVPEGSPARISHVLAAADFSQPSARAISQATSIARRAGQAACSVLHVIEPSVLGPDATAASTQARDELERFLVPLDLHGVEVRPLVEDGGSVASAAARHVEDEGVDLLVLGTRGRSRSAAVLLGSESELALLEATVPVLVTRVCGERIGVLKALLERDFNSTTPRFG